MPRLDPFAARCVEQRREVLARSSLHANLPGSRRDPSMQQSQPTPCRRRCCAARPMRGWRRSAPEGSCQRHSAADRRPSAAALGLVLQRLDRRCRRRGIEELHLLRSCSGGTTTARVRRRRHVEAWRILVRRPGSFPSGSADPAARGDGEAANGGGSLLVALGWRLAVGC